MCVFCGNSSDDHYIQAWLPYLMLLIPILLIRLRNYLNNNKDTNKNHVD